MAVGSFAESLSDNVTKLGRYFNAVNILPSAISVLYLKLLLASGAWYDRPNWVAAGRQLEQTSLGSITLLALVSLILGLLLHPLQFTFIQILEGYWGISLIGRLAAERGILKHRKRFSALSKLESRATVALKRGKSKDDTWNTAVLTSITRDESSRLLGSYPRDPGEVLPTKLGNVLRRYESAAGSSYGISAIGLIPHIALVATKDDVDLLDDQRTQLDLCVRLVVMSYALAVASVVFLWRDGLWLLVALIPYGAGYIFYIGAGVVAHDYGAAIAIIIDLNRFALYERLRLGVPKSLRQERVLNEVLRAMLDGDDPSDDLEFAHPPDASLFCLPTRRWDLRIGRRRG